jgi:transcriptional regulator with XRE-family HTH domain
VPESDVGARPSTRDRRRALRWTQRELARRAGLSVRTIHRVEAWERAGGRSRPVAPETHQKVEYTLESVETSLGWIAAAARVEHARRRWKRLQRDIDRLVQRAG